VVLADAIEDARRIRLRIDALADAAAELLREVRRDADKLTAELGFEPELLSGTVQLEPGQDGEQTDPTADQATRIHGAAAGGETDTRAAEPAGREPEVVHDVETVEEEPESAAVEPTTGEAEPAGAEAGIDEASPDEARSDRASGEGAAETKSASEPADAIVVEDDERKGREVSSVPCSACATTGQCSNCGGKGRRFLLRCTECGGSGRCRVCGGPGFVWSGSSSDA
jgi:hypothetical protein